MEEGGYCLGVRETGKQSGHQMILIPIIWILRVHILIIRVGYDDWVLMRWREFVEDFDLKIKSK